MVGIVALVEWEGECSLELRFVFAISCDGKGFGYAESGYGEVGRGERVTWCITGGNDSPLRLLNGSLPTLGLGSCLSWLFEVVIPPIPGISRPMPSMSISIPVRPYRSFCIWA